MATWAEINQAVSQDEGEHAVKAYKLSALGARVDCACGVEFAHTDKHAAFAAWFEHRAVRDAFPAAQDGR